MFDRFALVLLVTKRLAGKCVERNNGREAPGSLWMPGSSQRASENATYARIICAPHFSTCANKTADVFCTL